ncbi:hypothetical protein F0562_027893 [Nyssa sinensis]|uniref:Uncharacterized protein n=1 Tax=Nyssa sinensis TaxID=561372 RepID=A0A5J5B6S4_9ASTE|nr:hypothetical protein F0562_027893 [Nyssa sinensis]
MRADFTVGAVVHTIEKCGPDRPAARQLWGTAGGTSFVGEVVAFSALFRWTKADCTWEGADQTVGYCAASALATMRLWNTQATPLHTNSSISAVASQANSTCPLAAAPFHMQGDALATNYANRQAFRSSNSAAGVYSVEGSFGDGAPITYSASAVCTRVGISNTNGLEPTVQSTLGLRDLPNAFFDAVCPVANQVGEEIPQIFVTSTIPSDTSQVSSAINQSSILPVQPKTPVQSQTPVH